jgi:hypothetical protein
MTNPTPDADRLERLVGAYTAALEAGRMENAEAAPMEFLTLVAQTSDEPTPKSLLRDKAKRCEETADWAGAEAAYRRMLARAQAEYSGITAIGLPGKLIKDLCDRGVPTATGAPGRTAPAAAGR